MKIIETAEKLFPKLIKVLKAKNADYSGGRGEFDNFILAAKMAGVTVEQGILVRLGDKFSRLTSLLAEKRKAQVKKESVLDTIEDAINYLYILYAYIEDNINKGDDIITPHDMMERIIKDQAKYFYTKPDEFTWVSPHED